MSKPEFVDFNNEEEKGDDAQRYRHNAHRMQAGVAASMNIEGDVSTEPKFLRTGINAAMVDHGALIQLLIEKGIITLEEYTKKIADEMGREVERYEKNLTEHYGRPIKLDSYYKKG